MAFNERNREKLIKTAKLISFLLMVVALSYFASITAGINAQETISTEITFGPVNTFNYASTSHNSLAVLSSNKFVAAYKDGASSFDKGAVVVGNVSDSSVTYGLEYVFNLAATDNISAVALSETKFIVAYQDIGNSGNGSVIIGQVSGSEVSFGSEYVFNEANTGSISIAKLASDKFIVFYQDTSNLSQGTAIIGEVVGDSVSFGSEYIFNTATTDYISAAAFSETKFVIAYRDGGSLNRGVAVIGEIDGQDLLFGSEYIFNTATTDYISVDTLSGDKFFIAYRDVSIYLSYGTAIIGQVSGKEISFGSEYVFNSAITNHISASSLGNNKIVVTYKDGGHLNYGMAIVGEVSDKAVSFGLEYNFNPTIANYTFVKQLTASKFAIAFQDYDGGTRHGVALIGSIPAEEVEEVEEVEEPAEEPEETAEEEPEEETTEEDSAASPIAITDGALIRSPNAAGMAKFDIYIVKMVDSKRFKRLILSPHVFESYGHLRWEDVREVNQAAMDGFVLSDLVRAEGDTKVYQLMVDGDTGTKKWLNMTAAEFEAQGYDWDSIYTINTADRDAYKSE